MEKIIIKDSTTIKRYRFVGDEFIVEGEVNISQDGIVFCIRGSFYEKTESENEIGAYVGNFNGDWNGIKFNYTINNVTAENSSKVTNLIEEVNSYVLQIVNADEPEIPVPTEEDLLLRAKYNKLLEIDAYDISSEVNSFNIGELTMWLNVLLRLLIATQISANEAAGRETMTRWFNGIEFTFPISTWKLMLISLEIYAGDALNVTEAHKAAVSSLNTIEEVNSYDITVGYPLKLIFNI